MLKGGGALARVVVLALDFTVVATEHDCVQDCEPHIGCAAKRQAGVEGLCYSALEFDKCCCRRQAKMSK